MKKSILGFLFLVIGFSVKAQEYPNLLNPKTVTTIAYWELGDEQKYRITVTDEKSKGGTNAKISNSTISYDINLFVVEQADSFYIVEMEYSNYVFSNADIEKDEMMQEIMSMSEGLKIRYKINELGQFITIVNKKQLLKDIKKQIETIRISLLEKYKNEKEIANKLNMVFDAVLNSYTKEEQVDALYGDDIALIHGTYGFELELNKVVDIEMEYLVLTNVSVTGEGKLKLTTINKAQNKFEYTLIEKPNQEQMDLYMSSIVKSLIEAVTEEDLKKPTFQFEVKTTSKYVMELSSGWMHSVSVRQNTEVLLEGTKAKVSKTTTLTKLL